MLILAVGDIIGRPGRQATQELLPGLRQQYELDLVIANAENTAGGLGLTRIAVVNLAKAHLLLAYQVCRLCHQPPILALVVQ